MKTLKIIAFIVVVVVFIASTYLFIKEKDTSDVGGGAAGAFLFIYVIIPMVISGIVTLIVLLKSPRLYTYIFFGMLAAFFLYLSVLKVIALNKDRLIGIENTKNDTAEQVLKNTWNQLEYPTKVDSILKTLTNETELINEHKAARYLALSFLNTSYKSEFTKAITKTSNKGCTVITYLLENYKVNNEQELLTIFKVLKAYDQVSNLKYCVPREQKDSFAFENLIEKKYYKATIASMLFRELEFKEYYKKIKKIDHGNYRKQTIITLLNNIDFYYQDWNETYTITKLPSIVLALKEEKGFSEYLVILEQRLKKAIAKSNTDTKWKIYKNQSTQENFIKMQQLLGNEHPLFQLIPKKITTFYQKQEKEILKQGKNNYILYRNFLSQIEGDLEHIHAYTSEPYRIYSNDKLVHESISNRYGYISYKAYGAKTDDLIQIETSPTGRWEQRVGWISLLAPWNSYKGLHERLNVIGKHSSKGYTDERAKKAKALFDAYMDDKWSQNE